MFGQNIFKWPLQYGHARGGTPASSGSWGSSCRATRARLMKSEAKVKTMGEGFMVTLKHLGKKDLIAVCLTLGLETHGKKHELRARIWSGK